MERIVVGTDGSDCAAEALRWAAHEAGLHGAGLTVVLAWGYLAQHHVSGPEFVPGYGEEDARVALAAFVQAALGEEPGVEVDERVVCDLPAPALLEASAGADLLVVGARGLGGFRGLLLGSVSQACVHHADVPVAVVRAAADGATAERVVVGVDGSPESGAALRWAIAEAAARRAVLTVVHAWQAPYLGGAPYGVPIDPTPYEESARALLEASIAEVDVSGLAAPPERVLVCGGATPAILESAELATLVVVGDRGSGGFAGMLLGSVGHSVARHAACPVVLVPAPA